METPSRPRILVKKVQLSKILLLKDMLVFEISSNLCEIVTVKTLKQCPYILVLQNLS